MTIEQKNKLRVQIKKTLLMQWLISVNVILVGTVMGVDMGQAAAVLTASTTGMTAGLGLDYFSSPKDVKDKE